MLEAWCNWYTHATPFSSNSGSTCSLSPSSPYGKGFVKPSIRVSTILCFFIASRVSADVEARPGWERWAACELGWTGPWFCCWDSGVWRFSDEDTEDGVVNSFGVRRLFSRKTVFLRTAMFGSVERFVSGRQPLSQEHSPCKAWHSLLHPSGPSCSSAGALCFSKPESA